MDADQTLNEVESQLLRAEHILNTEYSFDLAESCYVKRLESMLASAELRNRFEFLLLNLFDNGSISSEPLAYLMHRLRWSNVLEWMQTKYDRLQHPIADGARFAKVIDAYSDNWENRAFYKQV